MRESTASATLAAYERWAPAYSPVPHNPLMRAEQAAMLEQWPNVAGKRALDLACGSGRYSQLLARSGAQQIVALDFAPAMLARVGEVNAGEAQRVRANMMQLPFASAAFDAVVCGLAVGHAAEIRAWMAEIARVLAAGGVLVYSDFHPEAARAGMTRTFKDAEGLTRTVPHRCYDLSQQRAAAAAAHLTIECLRELRLGVELRESFAGSEVLYRKWRGLPVVLIVRARKEPECPPLRASA